MNNKSLGFLCYVSAVRASGFGSGFDSAGVSSDFCSVEPAAAALLLSVCVSLLGSDGCDFPSDPDPGGEESSASGFDLIGEDFEIVLGVSRTWGKSSSIFDISTITNNNHSHLIYFAHV